MTDHSDKVALARITADTLVVATAVNAVSSATVGGIGVFVGKVRDHDHGRTVTALRYEAHPTAEQMLRDLCAKFASDDVISVAAEHRIGDLAINDIAVVVAVAAEHRGEALRATAQLIDAIKENVPIWKHQTFADGTTEWVACP